MVYSVNLTKKIRRSHP